MGLLPASSFQDYCATLTDPRCPNAPNSRHQLMDLLVIAVCAVICGAAGWADMEDDGKFQKEWFVDLRDIPHGIAGHDPFRRVLSRLEPEEWTQCCSAWTDALSDVSGGEIVAIDGTTWRHSFDRAASQSAIHLVSAWASANRVVLGQLTVEEQSKAIPAIAKLLRLLDVQDAVVTIDARGCQQERAQVITEQEADDVLALQENHQPLDAAVTLLFDEARGLEFADIAHAYDETVDGAPGRLETRRYWLTSAIEW